MAKTVQGKAATKVAAGAKKIASGKKKAAVGGKDGPPAKRAKRVGRTAVKKPRIDPEVEVARARNRAMWKSQAQEATSVELATLVDERARVRSTMGMSWSNRKPR